MAPLSHAAAMDMQNIHPATAALLRRSHIEQRTPAWYEARRKVLTASDVAAVLGIPAFESYRGNPRTECLTKKVENKPWAGNVFTRHGNKYEDTARDLMCEALGEQVLEFGLLIHPTLPYLGASPDGVTLSGKLIEIKCPLRRVIKPGVVPHHYLPQILVQLEVCDMEECYFVEYKPATNTEPQVLSIVSVQRDRQWFASVQEELHSFVEEYYEALRTYVPPPPLPPPTCRIVDGLYDGAALTY